MIIGIGTDIVDVSRVERLIHKSPAFIEKVFCPAEIEYCQSRANTAESFAARFAAKEAVMKALGTGWAEKIAFKEICVISDERGKPELILLGATKAFAEKLGVKRMHLTLSHEKTMALAFVILETE